jgi:E3 ubiquitin-protein ligase DOA10
MSIINEDELLPGDNQLNQSRICLNNDDPNDIISPCLCSRGSAYIHRKCLYNWQSDNANGKAFKFCDVC